MKKYYIISLLLIVILAFNSCDDDKDLIFLEPTAESVKVFDMDSLAGMSTVAFGSTHEFSTAQLIGAVYTWSVDGATFVDASAENLSNKIKVTFDKKPYNGNVTISVTAANKDGNSGKSKSMTVVVKDTKPIATLS